MNALNKTIIDQYRSVEASAGDPLHVLTQAQGEILVAATPELTTEILRDKHRPYPDREWSSTRAILRAQQDPKSVINRISHNAVVAHQLASIDVLAPGQGYVGGVLSDGDELLVFGSSMDPAGIKPDDPIQAAMGDTLYPSMMWVKSLRALAYKNRPESAESLSVAAYLAKLGLSLGCMITEYGDIIGATGFMPGERLQTLHQNPAIGEHIDAEPIEAFRLSGLCDQSVADPDILLNTEQFCDDIIKAGGSLN